MIVSGFAQEAEAAHQDVEADEQETIPHHRQQLEMYGFLLQWFVQATENAAAEKSASAAPKPKGKATKAKAAAGANKNTWDSSAQLLSALDTMTKVLRLKLQRIFPTNSERDSFVQLLTRPSYVILESEQRVKSSDMRMHVFKVLCMAIKHHGHAFGMKPHLNPIPEFDAHTIIGAQTSIVQSLSYFDHLSEPMAEFLQILAEQYDYPQLIDEILR